MGEGRGLLSRSFWGVVSGVVSTAARGSVALLSLFGLLLLAGSHVAGAQEEYYSVARKRDQRYLSLVHAIDDLMTMSYHFTGQEIYAPLEADDTLDWQLTLYGNTRYRIVIASNIQDPPISYTLQDGNRRVLFESGSVGSPAVWDFVLASSTECTLRLHSGTSVAGAEPRRVLLRVGFLPSYKELQP